MRSLRLGLFLLCSCFLVACTGELDPSKVQRLQKIELSSAPGDKLPNIESATTTEVMLPMRWRIEDQSSQVKWFKLSLQLPSTDNLAIFIPRVSSRMELWVNQSFAVGYGQRGDTTYEQGRQPLVHALDKAQLNVGSNQLWLRVEGGAEQTKGLSEIYVGQHQEIRNLYFQRWWREVGSVIAIVAACCVFGIFGLWFGLRLKMQYFISFGLASFGWALQSLPVLFSTGGGSHSLVFMLAEIGFGVFVSQIQLFALEQMKIKHRFLWLNAKFLFLIALVLAPTAYVVTTHTGKILDAYHALLLLSAVVTMPFIVVRAFQDRTTANWLLMLASVSGIAFGAHDYLMIQLASTGFSKFSLTRFSALIFLLSMLAIVLEKQIRSVQLEKHLNQELTSKINERELELREVYHRESQYKEDEIKRFEAEKISANVYTGMSAKLNALQFMMQDPKFDAQAGNQLVKDAIHQLSITTEAISPARYDLASIVGYQLYKAQAAFEAANLKVSFESDEIPQSLNLAPTQATHLSFLIQGLFDNVVKHAKASLLTVSIQYKPESHQRTLVIQDNGIGFDASAVIRGLVITNMKRNASRLGAQISLKTKLGGSGTKVILEWTS